MDLEIIILSKVSHTGQRSILIPVPCSVGICLHCGRPGFNPWVRKILWRREGLPTPVFLGFPGDSAGKNPPAMWEIWVQSLGWEDSLKK